MAVFCPNIGVLSASVLSLIPLMRPFAWQSLLLPVLPVQDKMLDLLEAPVPFILGIRVRCSQAHLFPLGTRSFENLFTDRFGAGHVKIPCLALRYLHYMTSLPSFKVWVSRLECPRSIQSCFPSLLRCCAQYKTAEVAARCKSLMRVNIYKDRLKNAMHLPALPNVASLASALSPPYWALHSIGREAAKTRPLYSITDDQKHAAESFLQVTFTSTQIAIQCL